MSGINMDKANSLGEKRGHSKVSLKKTPKSKKHSTVVDDASPAPSRSAASTKPNQTGYAADVTAVLTYNDQQSNQDTGDMTAPAWAQTQSEEESIVSQYSNTARPIIGTSNQHLVHTGSRDITTPAATMPYIGPISAAHHSWSSTETQHTGNGATSSSDAEEAEGNAHQLGKWAYDTSQDNITFAERVEKSNWTCARDERL